MPTKETAPAQKKVSGIRAALVRQSPLSPVTATTTTKLPCLFLAHQGRQAGPGPKQPKRGLARATRLQRNGKKVCSTHKGKEQKSTAPQTPGLVLGQCSVGRCWPSKNTSREKGAKVRERNKTTRRALVGQVWAGTSLATKPGPKINKLGPGWAGRARPTAVHRRYSGVW